MLLYLVCWNQTVEKAKTNAAPWRNSHVFCHSGCLSWRVSCDEQCDVRSVWGNITSKHAACVEQLSSSSLVWVRRFSYVRVCRFLFSESSEVKSAVEGFGFGMKTLQTHWQISHLKMTSCNFGDLELNLTRVNVRVCTYKTPEQPSTSAHTGVFTSHLVSEIEPLARTAAKHLWVNGTFQTLVNYFYSEVSRTWTDPTGCEPLWGCEF